MKRRAQLQEPDGNIDNENTEDISFKTRTPACLEEEGILPARYSSVLPPSPPMYHQLLLCSHSKPFVQSLELSLGLGMGDGDKGELELVPGLTAQHFGAGFCSPATEHRCQTAVERGASPQPLILKGLIVEMSCTSVQNQRRAFSF